MAEDRGHATTGANAPWPGCFPAGKPGRPISAGHLGQRLNALDVHRGCRAGALGAADAERGLSFGVAVPLVRVQTSARGPGWTINGCVPGVRTGL